MTDKNIKLVDTLGNTLFPKTKASIVENDEGLTLGGVEANAQENKIETITVNGKELTIVNKVVDIEISSASEYSLQKNATADTGYVASYQLTKDGVAIGEKINIPKDLVVESGSVKECTTANSPVSGYSVGDKYIDLVLANATDEHIYILVSDLIDVYTAGTGIVVTDNTIAIDTSTVATKTDLSSKQDSLTTAQLNAVNSGVTSAKITTYDGYATTIAQKADKATTLAGYGITDAVTQTQLTNANYITYVELI